MPEVVPADPHVRAPLDCHVGFTVGERRLVGRARDVSLRDLYVYTKEPAPVGAEIVVHVILPYRMEMLEIAGIVRAVRPKLAMDVQFVALDVDQTRAISDYIDAKLRRGSGTREAIPAEKKETGSDR